MAYTDDFTYRKGEGKPIHVRLKPKDPIREGKGIVVKVDSDRKAAEYVLSIGGTVRVNGEKHDLKALADLPSEKFQLTYVNLRWNKEVNDAGLASFDGCKNLTELLLEETQVSDTGLAHFKDCKNLIILWLHKTKVRDAGLIHFSDCKKLIQLFLNFTQVSDAGLAHFRDCKSLTHLLLHSTQVTNAGMVYFKDSTNLEVVELSRTQVGDAGLVHFKTCKNLKVLNLLNTQVSDAGMVYLKDCKELEALDLRGSKITDLGLSHLEITKLGKLELANTQVSDAGLSHFKDCEKLRSLGLQWTRVTAEGFEDLKKALPNCRIAWEKRAAVPGESPTPLKTADDYVQLYNGKDLTGWKVFPAGTGNWKVEDGVIVGSGNLSHLFSERGDYKDFHFRVECMINDKGNSGQFFRTMFEGGFPRGWEAQIAVNGDLFKTGSLYPDSREPDLKNLKTILVLKVPHKPNEWFTQEVIAVGPKIKILVNGKPTVEWTDPKDRFKTGHFALQQHSPATVVKFRKIEVKELSATTANPDPLASKSVAEQGKPITNSIGMKFVHIPAGKFMMGSPPAEMDRREFEQQHEVIIKTPFLMGAHVVTQKQYRAVMGKNPSHFYANGKGKELVRGLDTNDFPVDSVSWDDAGEFCKKLTTLVAEKKSGRVYRLPTEEEWEYACRAGTTTRFNCGDGLSDKQANCNRTLGRTCKVGSYPANRWGLYDMHGNLFQWCSDRFDRYYHNENLKKQAELAEPRPPSGLGGIGDTRPRHVVRGGSYLLPHTACGSARRMGMGTTMRIPMIGLRVVCVISAGNSSTLPPNRSPVAVETKTFVEERRIQGHAGKVQSITFSLDGRYLISGSNSEFVNNGAMASGPDNTARLWQVSTGKEIARLKSNWAVRGVALNSNHLQALSFESIWHNKNKPVTLWDVKAGTARKTFQVEMPQIARVAFSANNRRVLVGGRDGSVWSADLITGKQSSFPGSITEGKCMTFSPDGRIAVVGTGGAKATIRVVEVATGKDLPPWEGHEKDVLDLCFSADGRFAASASLDGTVRVWQVQNGKEVACLRGHAGAVRCVALSKDGLRVLSGGVDRSLRLWQVTGNKEIEPFVELSEAALCVTLSPDGKQAASVGNDHVIVLWSLP